MIINETEKPTSNISGAFNIFPELSRMGKYTVLKINMLKNVIIPRAIRYTIGKKDADTIVGTIMRIEKGLLIPPENKSSKEIWLKSKERNKNVLKTDNLFSVLKYMLEVKLTMQENKIIKIHAWTLKVNPSIR